MGNWWKVAKTKEDYEIDDTVRIAKFKLCDKFSVDLDDFEVNTSRKANVIEARRFLVYFLIRELDVRPAHIKYFIPSIQNHATALHHLKKMEDFMGLEVGKCEQYDDFRYSMVNGILDD